MPRMRTATSALSILISFFALIIALFSLTFAETLPETDIELRRARRRMEMEDGGRGHGEGAPRSGLHETRRWRRQPRANPSLFSSFPGSRVKYREFVVCRPNRPLA